MTAVILAGGLGTRLVEETGVCSKPMEDIGDRPILRHIIKVYFAFGIHAFIARLSYEGYDNLRQLLGDGF